MIGEKLGPYKILNPTSSGGMEEVWIMQDTRLGCIVAIKKTKEQHSERFNRESRSIAALIISPIRAAAQNEPEFWKGGIDS